MKVERKEVFFDIHKFSIFNLKYSKKCNYREFYNDTHRSKIRVHE